MPISSLWFQGAVLNYLLDFTVFGLLAYLVYPGFRSRDFMGKNLWLELE
jgi:hypothetical protein